MTTQRTSHPFHMYDAIRMQPDAFAEVCQSNVSPVDAAADRLPNAARIWLLGIGTSFHAAKIGKRLLEGSFPGIVRACHSFDFVTDAPAVGSKDAALVISHRGTKLYSRLSAERTRKAGAFTVAIVGKSSQQPPPADLVLETVEQELSPAHTVSFMGSVAMLSAIAAEISTRGQSAAVFPDRKLLAEIPAAIQKVIDSEPHIERLATDMAAARKIWIVGAGADQIAAQECALKIMETSFLQASGYGIEEILHGPFQSAEADDRFVLLANPGPGQSRVLSLMPMVERIGAKAAIFGANSSAQDSQSLGNHVVLPSLPPPFDSVLAIVGLQLLTYHIALQRHTNPDSFRLDDVRYLEANKLVNK